MVHDDILELEEQIGIILYFLMQLWIKLFQLLHIDLLLQLFQSVPDLLFVVIGLLCCTFLTIVRR